jgi:hypothetical protein
MDTRVEKEALTNPRPTPPAVEREIAGVKHNTPKAKSLVKHDAKSVLSTPTAQSLSTAAVSGVDGAPT